MNVAVLIVPAGDVADAVFIDLQPIGHLHQRLIPQVDLALAAGSHFVMMGLDLQAAVEHRLHHLAAEVHQLIGRRAGKIAFLVPQLIGQARLVVAAAGPLAFGAVEVIERLVGGRFEAGAFEDEKLGLGTEVSRRRRCPCASDNSPLSWRYAADRGYRVRR